MKISKRHEHRYNRERSNASWLSIDQYHKTNTAYIHHMSSNKCLQTHQVYNKLYADVLSVETIVPSQFQSSDLSCLLKMIYRH